MQIRGHVRHLFIAWRLQAIAIRSLAAVFLLSATAATAGSLTLSAAAGSFSTKLLTAPADALELEVVLVAKSEQGTEKWPSAAIVGLSDGPDRRNSLQVFLVRDRNEVPRVTFGLRLILEGVEVNSEELGSVATFGPATVTLSFREGRATVQVNRGRAIEVNTPFERVIPYAAVNSCTVKFDWKLRGSKAGRAAI